MGQVSIWLVRFKFFYFVFVRHILFCNKFGVKRERTNERKKNVVADNKIFKMKRKRQKIIVHTTALIYIFRATKTLHSVNT